MATKKPSSKKSAKKSSNTTKRAAKKIKNKAPEIIEATENKEPQLETLTVSEDTQQNTTETINNIETMPTEITQADTTAPTQDTSDTSSLAPSAAAVNTEQQTPEKQTYENLVVPQEKDNTYAFIIGGIVAILTIILFFL